MNAQKVEWRKIDKQYYLPGERPELIHVPPFKFLTIDGQGKPGNDQFTECLGALYSMSYALKMMPKKGELVPPGYYDYTVYPLEGVWSLNEKAIKEFDGTFNKSDLVYTLMIRQPDFIDQKFFEEIRTLTQKKKPELPLDKLQFKKLEEGKCVQMLHIGSYDDEPASFKLMETFTEELNLERISKEHREIYLNDFRKVEPKKLKTVLRFKVRG